MAQDAEFYPTYLTQGHRWFEPDVDSLAAALRDVAGHPEAARAKAAGAREELIEGFGTDAIVDRIVELACDVHERRMRPFSCVLRGPFGSNSSLSVVNDSLADALDARDEPVIHRAEGVLRPVTVIGN